MRKCKNDLVMEKKLYSTPHVEALNMRSLGSVMITSIVPDIPEPGSSAPRRRTPVF